MLIFGILALFALPIHANHVSTPPVVSTCSVPSGRLQRLNQALLIDGQIDQDLYDCFEKLFDATVHRVEIRSAGGDPHFAIPIAEQLSRVRPVISIKDFCGSACAYLILPTASKIESDGPSIVMFHNTATSSHESVIGYYENSEDLRMLSHREIDLYRKLGIDEWILIGPFSALNPICTISTDKNSTSFESEWKAVVLERPLLNILKFKLPDNVVDTPAKLMEYASKLPDHGRALLKGGIRFLSYDPGNGDLPQRMPGVKIPILPPCGQSEVRGRDRKK